MRKSLLNTHIAAFVLIYYLPFEFISFLPFSFRTRAALICTIHTSNSLFFETSCPQYRDGGFSQVRLTLKEALLGFTRALPAPDRRPADITRKSSEPPVRMGEVVRLAGRGLPRAGGRGVRGLLGRALDAVGSDGGRGDLVATIRVDLPQSLTKTQRQRLEEVL
jgi:DnaJ-class molecular chaperone